MLLDQPVPLLRSLRRIIVFAAFNFAEEHCLTEYGQAVAQDSFEKTYVEVGSHYKNRLHRRESCRFGVNDVFFFH